jgi:formyltetrahydrofolate synthetase
MHSGNFSIVPGKPLDEDIIKENIPAIEKGASNLGKQIENAMLFGVPTVIAINRFSSDTDAEVQAVRELALAAGASAVEVSDVWAKGGEGGAKLAEAVVEAANKPKEFKFLYDLDWSIKKKISAIAKKIYGASDVEYARPARIKMTRYRKLGWDKLPICMAKTHLSLSHDPALKGRPEGFTLPVQDINASIGAGFLYALCGAIRTMPGLPTTPAGENVDIDENGQTVGLF